MNLSKDSLLGAVRKMVIVLVISAVLVWFYNGEEAIDSFLGVSVALILINFVLLLFAHMQGANAVTTWAIIGLNIMGCVTQSVFILGPMADQMKMQINMLIALFGFILFWLLWKKTLHAKWLNKLANKCLNKRRKKKEASSTNKKQISPTTVMAFICGFLALASLGLSLLLPETHGAKNWHTIGGVSIQVTEFSKLFVVLTLGLLFESKTTGKNDWIKGIVSTVFMGVCGLLFLGVGELGICLVLMCVFLSLSFMYLKTKWFKFSILFLVIFAVAILGYVYYIVDSVSNQWECPTGNCVETIEQSDGSVLTRTKINHKELVCSGCNAAKYAKYPTFTCKYCSYKKFSPLPEGKTKDTYVCDICYHNTLLRGPLGDQVIKLYNRFSVWLNYKIMKYEDAGYQIAQGEKSAVLGGWFGNRETKVYVPNKTNDSVLVGMFNQMGFSAVLVVFFLYYLLFLEIRNAVSPVKTAAILCLCFQALIAAAGNFNLFALTGIGVPFISTGGSVYAITMILTFFVLSNNPCAKEAKHR